MDDGAVVGEGLAQLRAGLDLLLRADLTGLSGRAVADALGELETARRRAEAASLRLVAEAGERYLAGDYGATTTANLLTQRLRISPGEAKARVRRAGDLMPRRSLTGEPLPPILAGTAAALEEGAIGTGHATAVASALDAIPADIAYEASPVAEAMLVEAARHQNPVELRRTAAMLLARLDPDGRQPSEEEQARRRDLSLTARGDGSVEIRGRLTPECGAQAMAVVGALSAPKPAADGQADDRTAGQRRHDALHDALSRLLRAGTLPDCGGMPVTVLVRITADQLARTEGLGQTEYDELLSTRQVRAMAGDGAVQLVVTDSRGAVLRAGRLRRLATPDQRRALAVRDGGCAFPACTAPMPWTEVHHVVPWTPDGRTDIENLVALCGVHHREHERWGWQVIMNGGLPSWIPPPWIDPDQRPVRNTEHHLPEIDLRGSPPTSAR